MLKHYRKNWREWGLWYLPYYALFAILKRLGIVVCQVSTDGGSIDPQDEVEIPEGYEVRRVEIDELFDHVESDAPLTTKFVQGAKDRGDLCAGVFWNNEIVAFTFMTISTAPVTDQLELLIPNKFKYSYKGWVHPNHRRGHLSRAVNRVMFFYTREQFGSLRGIWYIEKGNFPSRMRGYRYPLKRGIRMGLIGWITIFGKQIPFNSRRAKWIGLKLVRNGDRKPYLYLA